MKHSLSIFIIVAVTVIQTACEKNTHTADNEVPDVAVALPVVDSVTLYRNYPGVLSAINTVDIVARVDGTLKTKDYESGSLVPAGSVLFTIEDTQYRDALQRAQAALESAESAKEYASSHYAALQQAFASNAVSRMEVEQGKNALETAEADIRTAKANIRTAETQLGYCTVRAPFTGHVAGSNLSVGSYVSGSGAPVTLTTLYKDDELLATFSIDDATMLPLIRKAITNGDIDFNNIPLHFTDTFAHRYVGALTYISPAVDTSTGTIELKAQVENPYNELHSGMFVGIALPYATERRAVMVKDASISRDQRGSYLYTIDGSNQVVYTPIELGEIYHDSLRIVTDGLSPDSRYVTEAILKVRSGMTVKPRLTR